MKTLKELGIALIHPGPLGTLFLINSITLTATYCTLMWWPPASSISGFLWLLTFVFFSGSTFYNFLSSMSVGPGYVPLHWKPLKEEDFSNLQYCSICQGYKAPRAHHCRKCGKCVLKMDHHCPWINECVGHRNHAHFVAFLISAVFGCSQATVIVACSLWRALQRDYYLYYRITDVPMVYLGGLYGLAWCLFVLGCAFGVALGVAVLLYYQLKILLRNKTSIEEWIEEKAQYRRKVTPGLQPYVHPYDFGPAANWWFVMNLKCQPEGDGIDWPVVPSCDQYTLTIEQIEQKEEKQKRVQEVITIEEFSGNWCPISKGFCIAFHPPCSDETRIPLSPGDKVLVSRWKKYWVYGEKILVGNEDTSSHVAKDSIKGWFPRRCVVPHGERRHRPACKNQKRSQDNTSPTNSSSGRICGEGGVIPSAVSISNGHKRTLRKESKKKK